MRRYIPFGVMRPDANDYDNPDLQEAANVLPLFNSYWSLRRAETVSSINNAAPPTSPDGLSGITGSAAHFYTADRTLARIGLIQDTITGSGWTRFGPVSEDDTSLYLQIDDGVTPDDETGILFQIPEGAFTPGGVLARTQQGLVFEDDFNRSDGALGSPWSVENDADVTSNRFSSSADVTPNTEPTGAQALVTDAEATEAFGQAILTVQTSSGRQSNLGFYSTDKNGYAASLNQAGSDLDIFRYDGAADFTGTQIATAALASLGGDEDILTQFYLAPGVQEAYARETGTSNTATTSAVDATHDAVDKFLGIRNVEISLITHNTNDMTADNAVWMTSKNIVVSGLSAGQKAKVLNSVDAVVAEATESSGVATIDASRFGGATEDVPLDGWAALIVTDSLDVELQRFDSAGVYPGDTFVSFSDPNANGRATYEALFEEMVDPSTDDDHTITYRYRFNGQPLAGEDPFLGALSLDVSLYEGSTDLGLIAHHETSSPDDTWVHNSVEIPTAITSLITDYGDLRVRFLAEVIAGEASDKFPDEDISTAGVWTNESGGTTNLFQSVNNEPGVAGDSTFIESPEVVPGGVARYRSGLEDGASPFTFDGFNITVRAKGSEPGVELRVSLQEDGVSKAGRVFTDIPITFTDHVFNISSSDIEGVQDFSNLEMLIGIRASGGSSDNSLQLFPTAFDGPKVSTTGNVTALQTDNDVTVDSGNGAEGGRFRVLLDGGTDPGTNENHQIRMRAHKTGSGRVGTSVQLYSGGSIVFDSRDEDGSSGRALAAAEQDEVFTIPVSVAQNLTYTGLKIQVLTHKASANSDTAVYDLLALEIPGGKSAQVSSIQFSYPARAWVGVSYTQLALPDAQSGEIGDVTEIYAGTYESIYEVDEAGWTDVSKTGHYAQTESPRSWHFWPFGENIIATNKADPVQVRSPGDAAFSDLIVSTDKPRAATVAASNHHLILGNIDFTGPPDGQTDEWWCSAFDDPTDFQVSAATGSNRGRLQDTPGEIVKMVGGEFVLVFKRNSIHRLDYVGEIAPVFRDSVVSYTDGTRYTRSVVQVGRDVYFYDSDGFKVVRNGSFVEPVGQGQITRFVTDSEFEDFAPRAITTDREALADTAVIGTYDPVTGLIWWAIRGTPSSTSRVNQEWFNNSVIIYNPKEDRFAVMRTATSVPPFSPCALIGMPGAKQSAETITRGVAAIMMGEDFLTGNFHADFLRFTDQKTYPATFRTKVWTTKMLLGESAEGLIRGVRPVFRMASALARPDVAVFIDSADDPLMQFDVVEDNSSLAEANEDGWYTFSQMNEFFTFDVQVPEMDRQTIREVAGLEFDIPDKPRGSGRY